MDLPALIPFAILFVFALFVAVLHLLAIAEAARQQARHARHPGNGGQ